MSTPILLVDPVSDAYSFIPANEIVETKLDGGQSRRRRDFISSTHTVNAQWIRENTKRGSLPFRANLVNDLNLLMPHVCVTTGGLPKLVQQRGNAFWVTCTLEVFPNPTASFSLFLQYISVEQFVNAGTAFYTGDLSDFPVGRSVLLTGTAATVAGTAINLDGTYVMDSAPNAFTRTLINAHLTNSDWTVLNGLGPQSYFPGDGGTRRGAAVLVPV